MEGGGGCHQKRLEVEEKTQKKKKKQLMELEELVDDGDGGVGGGVVYPPLVEVAWIQRHCPKPPPSVVGGRRYASSGLPCYAQQATLTPLENPENFCYFFSE